MDLLKEHQKFSDKQSKYKDENTGEMAKNQENSCY